MSGAILRGVSDFPSPGGASVVPFIIGLPERGPDDERPAIDRIRGQLVAHLTAARLNRRAELGSDGRPRLFAVGGPLPADTGARAAVGAAIAAVRAGHSRVLSIAGPHRAQARVLAEWTASSAAAAGVEVLRARPRVASAGGVLRTLLHREAEPASGGSPPEATADAMAAVLGCLLGSLANVAPLAIVVEDAHLADELSLRTLVWLVAHTDELPVLLFLDLGTSASSAMLDALARVPSDRVEAAIRLPA